MQPERHWQPAHPWRDRLALPVGGRVGQRRGRFRGQARDAQARLVDDALAGLRQLDPALVQANRVLETQPAILELLDDLLQLVVGALEAGHRYRAVSLLRAQWLEPYWSVDHDATRRRWCRLGRQSWHRGGSDHRGGLWRIHGSAWRRGSGR